MINWQKSYTNGDCSLSELYKDVRRYRAAYNHLEVIYNEKLLIVLTDANLHAPYLVAPTTYFAKEIKKYFIEEGRDLNDIKDLERLLKLLNYLDFENFRTERHNYVISLNG